MIDTVGSEGAEIWGVITHPGTLKFDTVHTLYKFHCIKMNTLCVKINIKKNINRQYFLAYDRFMGL